MRKKYLFTLCLLLTATISCTAVQAGETAQKSAETEQPLKNEEETDEEKMFGEFETITLEGEEVSQEIFAEADLNMVNIWATYCGPCIREMPDLGTISREYAEQGFQIIGIISDVAEAKDEDAEAIVSYTQADYTHLLLSWDLLQNYVGQVQVVPTTVFVDGEGKQVGEVYAGSRTEEEWKEIIDGLLQELSDEE